MLRDLVNAQSVHATATVGVVLVNWNGAKHTIPCVASLLAGSERPDWIVVVDNASHDGSADLILETFPSITLLRNSDNLGFTGANNVGINRLMTLGCSYIWILNNDTTVDQRCLSVLRDYLCAHPGVSACSGKILYAEPQNLIWYAGATYDPWTMRSKHRGEGAFDVGQYEQPGAVPFLSGCCMFVRRETIEHFGVFDDRFFAYDEDSDWCLRVMEANRRLDYVPNAILWHKVSATVRSVKARDTSGTTSPFSIYVTNRNRLFVIRKHAARSPRLFTALLRHALWVGYYGMALLLMGRLEKFRALIMSAYDGMTKPLDEAGSIKETPRYLK